MSADASRGSLRRFLPVLAVLSLVGGLSLAPALTSGNEPQAEGDKAATCVQHRAEARYRGYGYDHIVVLTNECDKDATCEVSTDVNPEPTSAMVRSGETKEVQTFRGSPARTFTAKVRCQIKR